MSERRARVKCESALFAFYTFIFYTYKTRKVHFSCFIRMLEHAVSDWTYVWKTGEASKIDVVQFGFRTRKGTMVLMQSYCQS